MELEIGLNKRPTGLNVLDYNNPEVIANATLPREAHIQFETAITGVARKTLMMFNELTAAGLQIPLRDIGVSIYEYQLHSERTKARINMSFPASSENDNTEYQSRFVSIPFVLSDFVLDDRQIAASRHNANTPIDTINVEESMRVVGEGIETLILNGSTSIVVQGNVLEGMTNFTGVNTFTLPLTWTNASADIIEDTKSMIEIMRVANYRRGLRMRVSDNYWTKLQCDYNDVKGTATFRDRILQFAQIDSVEVTEFLDDDTVMLYAADRTAIVLPIASDIQVIEHKPTPFTTRWYIWAALSIAPKVDFKGQSGILIAQP